MGTTILLVRHGETDWNRERRVQGQTDRPLTEDGRAQAVALARELATERVAAVYSSDLTRARDTAREIAEPRGLPVHHVRELREKDFGTWEGLTDTEVLERFPEARTGPWGDAETNDELASRVLEALRRIAREHHDETVIVVTHGGPVRAVLRACDSAAADPIGNCEVCRLAVQDGSFRRID